MSQNKQWEPASISEGREIESYLPLDKGYLSFENAKRIKFGTGSITLILDIRYGFWTGNQTFALAPVRISSTGTMWARTIRFKNLSTSPVEGEIGEIAVVGGTVYVCTAISPLTWSKVGAQ